MTTKDIFNFVQTNNSKAIFIDSIMLLSIEKIINHIKRFLITEKTITKRKIENVSSDAQGLTNEIIENRNEAIKALAVQMGETDLDNADDVLAAEVELQGIIQKNFVEGSRMHPRLIRMVSNLMLRASKLVGQVTNTKIKRYNKLLTVLEAEASRRGVKAFDLIGEVRENDLKLINKINPNYWKERSVAVADSDKSFFIKNMDVTSYKKEVSEILKRQYKQIDEAIHNLDPEKNEQIKKWQKAQSMEEPILEAMNFVSIITGVPDLLISSSHTTTKQF